MKETTRIIIAALTAAAATTAFASFRCRLSVPGGGTGESRISKVTYANDGALAIAAPYVRVEADANAYVRFTASDAWAKSIEFLATSAGNSPGSLGAGETSEQTFLYMADTDTAQLTLSFTESSGETFPWDEIGASLKPSYVADDAWKYALNVLKKNLGTTWDSYLGELRYVANSLAKNGCRENRIDRLLQVEINRALGITPALPVLASVTDAARPARGLSLAFTRSYSSAMYGRFTKGMLGYGWTDNLSTCAELSSDGQTLVFRVPGGGSYSFTKVTGTWQPEDTRDKTVLAESSSAYTLTYQNGTVQTFAKSNMRTSSIADNCGNVLTFTWSGTTLQKISHTDGQSLTFAYSNGFLSSVTDDCGRKTTYTYSNSNSLLKKVTDADGLETSYEYRYTDDMAARALSRIVYPDGSTREFAYDDSSGFISSVSANGGREKTGFDNQLVRTVMTSPDDATTTIQYGASGETRKTTDALGGVSTMGYSDDGLLESFVAPSGLYGTISHDARGRVSRSKSPSGAATAFSYEETFGNLATVTDAKNNSVAYGYDEKGRGTTVTFADGSCSTLEYNDRGDVVKSTNRRGQAIAYEYDSQGRVTKKAWSDGRIFTYAYDGRGNLTAAADSETGIVRMQYDSCDRLVDIEYPKGRGFSFRYDDCGRLIERTSHDGAKECFAYDQSGMLATVSDGATTYLRNTYDAKTGRLTKQVNGNGTSVSYLYDKLGRVASIEHCDAGGKTAEALQYCYDADGRCIRAASLLGEERYEYDKDGQLTAVEYPDGTDESFAYDAVGNRTAANGATYTVNAMNQYSSVSGGVSPVSAITYDNDGNMTSLTDANGKTSYYYDTLNRLVAVTNAAAGIRWSCRYDVFGNRVSVTDNGVTTERTYLQGSLPSVAAEYVNGQLKERHIVVGAVRIASLTTHNSQRSTSFYHADLIGSTRLVTDGNGAIVDRRAYKAFGETRVGNDATSTAGYVGTLGVETDPTGLLFMRNRYYSPTLGRFIQMDPIGLRGEDKNGYRYCENNPTECCDIIGLTKMFAKYRQTGEEYHVGREGCGPFAPGGTITGWLENNIPYFHAFGYYHDAVVDELTNNGVPDLLANGPTMVGAYVAAARTGEIGSWGEHVVGFSAAVAGGTLTLLKGMVWDPLWDTGTSLGEKTFDLFGPKGSYVNRTLIDQLNKQWTLDNINVIDVTPSGGGSGGDDPIPDPTPDPDPDPDPNPDPDPDPGPTPDPTPDPTPVHNPDPPPEPDPEPEPSDDYGIMNELDWMEVVINDGVTLDKIGYCYASTYSLGADIKLDIGREIVCVNWRDENGVSTNSVVGYWGGEEVKNPYYKTKIAWFPLTFAGTLNGNGHTVTVDETMCARAHNAKFVNVKVKAAIAFEGNSYGKGIGALVGTAIESSFEDCFSSGSVAGDTHVGGLVGCATGSKFTNCSSSCTVKGTRLVGGFAGSLEDGTEAKPCTVTNCKATGNVYGREWVGGFAGMIDNCKVTSCSATGTVAEDMAIAAISSKDSYFGGFAGRVSEGSSGGSVIELCNASGSVLAGSAEDVGGFAGAIVGNSKAQSTVSRCCATGDATGGDNVGGFAGCATDCSILDCLAVGAAESKGLNSQSNAGGLIGAFADDCALCRCYASGKVTVSSSSMLSFVGGLMPLMVDPGMLGLYESMGMLDLITLASTSCYWNIGTTGQDYSGTGTGLTAAQANSTSSYSGWDFGSVWQMGSSGPELRNVGATVATAAKSVRTAKAASRANGGGVSRIALKGAAPAASANASASPRLYCYERYVAVKDSWYSFALSADGSAAISASGLPDGFTFADGVVSGAASSTVTKMMTVTIGDETKRVPFVVVDAPGCFEPIGSWLVTFDANGGSGEMPPQRFARGGASNLPYNVFTRKGFRFAGWATSANGAKVYSDGQNISVASNMTLYAVWTEDQYVEEYFLVYFDNNGGGRGSVRRIESGAVLGDLPVPARAGYAFAGWWTAATGGTQVSASTRVTADVTYYAHWSQGSGGAPSHSADSVDQPWTAAKATTLNAALFDGDGNVVGVVQLKVAKPNARKGTTKVSGSVTPLVGKKAALKARTVAVPADAPIEVVLDAKTYGTFMVAIGDDGVEGELGDLSVRSVDVGGYWTRDDARVYADFDADYALPLGVLKQLLPAGEPVLRKNGKWAFAKAAQVKLAKDKATGLKGLVVNVDNGRTNKSAMKLTYAPKTGIFKGSFKIYAVEGDKLKKYSAKVKGVVVEGEGTGIATLQGFGSWPVSVASEGPVPVIGEADGL